jgi:preprotein translocase subunit SecE
VKEGKQAFMAKDQGAIQTNLRPRGAARASVVAEAPKKPFNLVQFYREVRAEARKVTWTSWKETWITSVMVGIMVVVTSLFFFTVDGVFGVAMDWILKLGTAGT